MTKKEYLYRLTRVRDDLNQLFLRDGLTPNTALYGLLDGVLLSLNMALNYTAQFDEDFDEYCMRYEARNKNRSFTS